MPSVAISIRFSTDEHAQLKALAKQHGQPIGAYIRARLFAVVHKDEKAQLLAMIDRHEKLLKALLVLGYEAVNYERDSRTQDTRDESRARAKDEAAATAKSLLGN